MSSASLSDRCILLYNPLPERLTERVDRSKERRKKELGRMLKESWLVVAVLRERSVQPFHLRDDKVGHPYGFSVGEWHCIIVRHTVVLLRGSAEFPTTMRYCFLSSQRFISETYPWRRHCNSEAVTRYGVGLL